MRYLARLSRTTWSYRQVVRRDLLVVLLASVILGVAFYLPTPPLPFTRLYLNLHPLETTAIGSYAWSETDFHLSLQLEQVASQALVRQRMTAGGVPADARPIRVSAGATTFEFMVQGGTPVRTYTYLLPVAPDKLVASFSIAPLNKDQPNDKRVLGVLLMDTQVRLLGAGWLPGPAVLALVGLPLTLLVAALAWGLGPLRRPALLLIVLLIALFYRADPYMVLLTTIPINAGLLLVAGMGYLCQRLLQAADDVVRSIVLWSLAAVIGPWTYIAAGLWIHMGRQWIAQPLLTCSLLGLPVVAALLYIWTPAPRWAQLVLGGMALGGVLGWGLANFRLEMTYFAVDFSAYYYGIQNIFNGQPLYDPDLLRETPFFATYKYHPFFLFFMLPFAFVPIETAIMLWRSMGVIMIIASCVMIIAAQQQALRWRLIVAALVIATNLAPIGQTLRLGQTDPLILFSIVIALISFRRYRWLSAGIWGVLGLIKIYPLFLLLPSLLQRAWRWLVLVGGMLILGTIASLAFGWENQQIYWRKVVPLLGEYNGRLTNQSIHGLIMRLVHPDIIRGTETMQVTPEINLVFRAIVAVIFGLTLWLLWRRRLTLPPWETMSLLICTMLLIMPVSWDHYETLLVLPLLVGIALTLREPNHPTLWLVAAYALLAFGISKNLWQGETQPTTYMIVFMAYRTLGLILLWGWWLYAYATRPEDGVRGGEGAPLSAASSS